MDTPRLLLLALAATGFFYVVLPIMADVYFRFRGRRSVVCPETGCPAEVELDAWHAAATAIPGPPRLYVAECSRWPEHERCGQRCVASPKPG